MRISKAWAALSGLTVAVACAGGAAAAEAKLRVVDVGNALCVVGEFPGDHFLLYDAGNFDSTQCRAAVREIVGNRRIDLVVLSHSDADHIGELAAILKDNPADYLVYTGRKGTSKKTWPKAEAAIIHGEKYDHTKVRNLYVWPLPNTPIKKGDKQGNPLTVKLGDATATFVAGWYSWPYSVVAGHEPDSGERNNIVSVVLKVEYGGKSVLLTGDTVGRRRDDPDTACRDAERWMVKRGNVSLKSDVLIGQHHGGNNSSAACFIDAVQPDFVILPAGNAGHGHPKADVANRYLTATSPLPKARLFRTDLGDDEGSSEWSEGRVQNCQDPAGDDDIEITLSDNPATAAAVHYRGTSSC